MTSVTSKQAAVLAYLSRHNDLGPTKRRSLVEQLEGPARELATELASKDAEKPTPKKRVSRRSSKQKANFRSSAKRSVAA